MVPERKLYQLVCVMKYAWLLRWGWGKGEIWDGGKGEGGRRLAGGENTGVNGRNGSLIQRGWKRAGSRINTMVGCEGSLCSA